jgi:hypothetical protein
MNQITNLILKNGINSLIFENENSFKKSLTNSLSIKLNNAISEVEKEFKEKMFESTFYTELDEDMNYFLEFVENYDSKINNKLKFKNNTTINIKDTEMKDLKEFFNSLNPSNRKVLVKSILENSGELKKNLNFYQMAKGITNEG